MNVNKKQIFVLITVLIAAIVFASSASAAGVSNDTVEASGYAGNSGIIKESNYGTNIGEIQSDNKILNKEQTQYETKPVKTTSEAKNNNYSTTSSKQIKQASANPSSYDELCEDIKSEDDSDLTVNLEQTTYKATGTINSFGSTTVTINGNGATIDGNNQYQFMNITNGVTVYLNDLTIANARGAGSGNTTGGAILNNGTLYLKNVTFANNNASYGGAIYNNGTLNADNSSFIQNNATFFGGAIYTEHSTTTTINNATFTGNKMVTLEGSGANDYGGAGIYALGSLAVNDTLFSYNYVAHNDVKTNGQGGVGGAIELYDNREDVTIANSTFAHNEARFGSAVNIYDASQDAGAKLIDNCLFDNNTGLYGTVNTYNSLNITNCNFTNNNVTGIGSGGNKPYGAGLLVSTYLPETTVYSINNTFINNTADDGNGGAVAIGSAKSVQGTLIINNNTFANNSADYGGAVWTNGTINITNSTFENNSAKQAGAIDVMDGVTNITNSTFENNNASGNGGAIYSRGKTNINSSAFENNSAKSGGALYFYKGEANIANSTFENNNASGNGGAIFSRNSTNINSSSFENNSAANGGVLYVHKGESTMENSTATNNSANDGAVLYTKSGTEITFQNNTLANNTATSDTGKVMEISGKKTISENKYSSNGIENTMTATQETYLITLGNTVDIPITLKLNDVYDISMFNGNITVTDNDNIISTKEVNNDTQSLIEYTYQYEPKTSGIHTLTINFTNSENNFKNNSKTLTFNAVSSNSFTYLQYLIDNTAEGETLTLNQNYTWNAADDAALTDGIKINKTIAINGNGYTINATKNSRIFNATSNLILANAILVEGNAGYGGAIYTNDTLAVENVTFEGNTADYWGGAIYATATSDAAINNATFTNNNMTTLEGSTSNSYGGGAIATNGKLSVNGTLFDSNIASHYDKEPDGNGGLAGAILVIDNTRDVTIANSTFTRNEGRHGSAVTFLNASGANAIDNCVFDNNTGLYGTVDTYNDLAITNTNFTNNLVTGEGSGGRQPNGAAVCIIADSAINPTPAVLLENNTYVNNTADGTGVGGAISVSNVRGTVDEAAKVIINNNTFANNTAGRYGGAILTKGNVIVNNSVFENNTAALRGGAITLFANNIAVENSTLNNNSAGDGGLLYSWPGTTLEFNGNTAANNTVTDDSNYIMQINGTAAITGNTFANNTAYDESAGQYEDRLIKNTGAVDTSGNVYTDNYLETSITCENEVNAGSDDLESDVTVTTGSVYQNTVNSGYITVAINNNPYDEQFEVIDGSATISIPNNALTNCTNALLISYVPATNDYQASENTITAAATNYTTKITSEIPDEMTAKKTYGINITLKDIKNNKPLANQIVTITTETGSTTKETDSNGNITYQYTANINDKTFNITYNGYGRFNQTSQNNTLAINKINTKVTLTVQPSTKINKTVTIYITLVDEDQNTLDKELDLTINGTQIPIATENGQYSYDYTPENAGSIEITASYGGDQNYTESSNNTRLEIYKLNTAIEFESNPTIKVNETTQINITLKDENGNSLIEEMFLLTIDGTPMLLITNETGTANYTYCPQTSRTVTLTAAYYENDYYLSSSNATSITANKVTTKLTINENTTIKIGKTIAITGKLTDEDCNGLNKELYISINGNAEPITADNNGVYAYEYTPENVGVEEIRVVFIGDNVYTASEACVNITVEKINTAITIENVPSAKVNESTQINITLKDEYNRALAGQTITLAIDGTPITLTTNGEGMANCTCSQPTANIKQIAAAYKGNDTYAGSTNTSQITINRLTTNMVLDSIATGYNETLTLKAIITDENGNPVNGGKVAFKLNGKTVKDSQGNVIYGYVVNGIAQITIENNYSAKSYVLTAVYSGTNDIYESARSTESTLTIVPANSTMAITPNAYTTQTGGELTVTVAVNHNNTKVNTGKVALKINGLSIRDSNGNVIYGYVKNGTATMTFKIPSNLKTGAYNLTAVYGGKNYNRCETSTIIAIRKKD